MAEPDSWAPLFDPTEFNTKYGPLEIEKYQLSNEQLKEFAMAMTKIRRAIVEKAK